MSTASRLEDMQIYLEVVQRGGFSAAAEHMGFSKQYVSRRVAALEDRLGVRLLNRTTRRLSPTVLGLDYYERAARIVAEVEDTDCLISSHGSLPKGRLRVSAPLSHALHAPASAMVTAFLARCPDVEIDIDYNDRFVDLIHEGYDLAVRIGPLADSSLIARRLSCVRYLTVASQDYLAQHGTPAEPAALQEHRCLLYGHGRPVHWHYRIDGRDQALAVHGRLRANNGEILCRDAIEGGGIAQLPDFIVDAAVAEGLLNPVLQNYEPAPAGVFAIYPQHRQASALVQSFIEFLYESLNGSNAGVTTQRLRRV